MTKLKNKSIIDIEDLSVEEVNSILDLAETYSKQTDKEMYLIINYKG